MKRDDGYTFSYGEKSFEAKKDGKHPHSICFTRYNKEPFDNVSITDPDLLLAQRFLNKDGLHSILIEFDNEEYMFPVFETIQQLQEIHEDIQILFTMDVYDGPISGVITHHDDLYWFEWCIDHVTQVERNTGRAYSLRKLTSEMTGPTKIWADRYQELLAEFQLVANPHIWPVSDWQQKQLKSLVEIEADMEKHNSNKLGWSELLITAWMSEIGPEFAGIQTFTLSEEDSKNFEQWQLDVADALRKEDQLALDKLFVHPIGPLDKRDIFRFDITKDGRPFYVLRDFRGRPLPQDFWMTSHYRIQNMTYILSS